MPRQNPVPYVLALHVGFVSTAEGITVTATGREEQVVSICLRNPRQTACCGTVTDVSCCAVAYALHVAFFSNDFQTVSNICTKDSIIPPLLEHFELAVVDKI